MHTNIYKFKILVEHSGKMFINFWKMTKLDEPSTTLVYKLHECNTKMFINVYKFMNLHETRAKNVCKHFQNYKFDEPSTPRVYKLHECNTKMFINVYKFSILRESCLFYLYISLGYANMCYVWTNLIYIHNAITYKLDKHFTPRTPHGHLHFGHWNLYGINMVAETSGNATFTGLTWLLAKPAKSLHGHAITWSIYFTYFN